MKTLETHIAAVAQRLKTKVWWVGGTVRDALLLRPSPDRDVVCKDARRFAKTLARRTGGTFITLDDQFQIYRVVMPKDSHGVDVAELHGGTILADLGRRDFSINAMAIPIERGMRNVECGIKSPPNKFRIPNSEFPIRLIDPFSGQTDLRRRRIRALSQKALKDDPIRRLRAFRFAAQLGFTIEPKTKRWLTSGPFKKVAAEREREELLKLLSTPCATETLVSLDKSGLLTELFPELEACRRTAVSFYGRGGVLKHSLNSLRNLEWILASLDDPRAPLPASVRPFIDSYVQEPLGGYPRSAWLKLGALLHDIGKPATAQRVGSRLRFFGHEERGADLIGPLASRMRLSRQETQVLRLWVKHHMRLGSLAAAAAVTPKAFFRYFRDLGREGLGMILVSLADHFDYLAPRHWGKNTDPVEKMARRMIQLYWEDQARLNPPRLLDGHDIMKHLKIKPSPVVGWLLKKVEEAQVDGQITTKEQALRSLRGFYRASKGEILAQARSQSMGLST